MGNSLASSIKWFLSFLNERPHSKKFALRNLLLENYIVKFLLILA